MSLFLVVLREGERKPRTYKARDRARSLRGLYYATPAPQFYVGAVAVRSMQVQGARWWAIEARTAFAARVAAASRYGAPNVRVEGRVLRAWDEVA